MAIATPPGVGAIGIVRVSGPRAVPISNLCFRGQQSLVEVADRSLTLGRFSREGVELDEVLAAVMRGPRSFTGEDVVEFNCHGGPFLLRSILEALVESGARLAEHGEFTKRAFLNGRIDLTQAEAVAEMIQAKGDYSLRSAYFQLRGGLRTRLESLAEDLRQALTLIEANLDFSEDADLDPEVVRGPIELASGAIGKLRASYRQGKRAREGARVALAGRPNVGKSSLLNRLLEEDRAIVTEIPGTTRDTIEETIDLNGLLLTIVDTAGLRESRDRVEEEGARRTRIAVEAAELVLVVVDGSLPIDVGDLEILDGLDRERVTLVINKRDLGVDPTWGEWRGEGTIELSALTGEGVEELRNRLETVLLKDVIPSSEVVTQERHAIGLERAEEALGRASEAFDRRDPGEFVAMELRESLDALGEIVGETTSDDILDRIFKSFCIGK